jgi:hypothetical protein
MNKKVILIGVVLLTIVIGAYYFLGSKKENSNAEQDVLSSTLSISQEYSRLRYQTDNVLVKAKDYQNYDDWNKEMSSIIEDWKTLENEVLELEKNADKLTNQKTVTNLVKGIYAYDSVEVQKVIEKAPMGRQVRTLAKHLGVDAKMAQLILNESQDRISREIWGGEGDVYQGLEQDAMRIKNGAKVTVFVGGVVLTGGMSAVATSGVVAKTALVVSGADLVLEVADDEAKIALGDRNKVSKMVGKIRTVTEPAASILTVVNMPGNLSKAMEKVSALSFAGDQIRSVAQDEKILGINIKVDEKGEVEAKVSGLTEEELPKWREENNATESNQTAEEILVERKESVVEEKTIEKEEVDSMTGSGWEGTLSSMSGGDNQKRTIDFDFILNQDGSVSGSSFKKWKQNGDRIKMYGEDESTGYYEFKVSKHGLLLTKIVIGDEVIQPGEEYMGGIAPAGYLSRKSSSEESNLGSSKNAMPFTEYNEMDDKGLLKNILSVEKYLGKPDVKTTDDNGRAVYVYYDLVKYDSGNLGSVKMTFYDEDDYKSYIKNMGASWESNKENWDESGGGIRATSEIKNADVFRQKYGE